MSGKWQRSFYRLTKQITFLRSSSFIWNLNPNGPIYPLSLLRSITGSSSYRMRQKDCVHSSSLSWGWSWRTWQATPLTWSAWPPSMQQGMAHALRPPEGGLSKQVHNDSKLPHWPAVWLWNNSLWDWEKCQTFYAHGLPRVSCCLGCGSHFTECTTAMVL